MRIFVLSLITLISIGCQSNRQIFNEAEISGKICNCFPDQTKGNIDERLQPCINEFINKREQEIRSNFPEVNYDSLLTTTLLNVMILMIRNCDSFYAEIDSMYYNTYPCDTSEDLRRKVININSEILSTNSQDSLVSKMHEQISNYLQLRDYRNAIEFCNKIISLKPNEVGAYLALGYAFNGLSEFDKAISSIEKAIEFENTSDYLIQREITLRRGRNGQ